MNTPFLFSLLGTLLFLAQASAEFPALDGKADLQPYLEELGKKHDAEKASPGELLHGLRANALSLSHSGPALDWARHLVKESTETPIKAEAQIQLVRLLGDRLRKEDAIRIGKETIKTLENEKAPRSIELRYQAHRAIAETTRGHWQFRKESSKQWNAARELAQAQSDAQPNDQTWKLRLATSALGSLRAKYEGDMNPKYLEDPTETLELSQFLLKQIQEADPDHPALPKARAEASLMVLATHIAKRNIPDTAQEKLTTLHEAIAEERPADHALRLAVFEQLLSVIKLKNNASVGQAAKLKTQLESLTGLDPDSKRLRHNEAKLAAILYGAQFRTKSPEGYKAAKEHSERGLKIWQELTAKGQPGHKLQELVQGLGQTQRNLATVSRNLNLPEDQKRYFLAAGQTAKQALALDSSNVEVALWFIYTHRYATQAIPSSQPEERAKGWANGIAAYKEVLAHPGCARLGHVQGHMADLYEYQIKVLTPLRRESDYPLLLELNQNCLEHARASIQHYPQPNRAKLMARCHIEIATLRVFLAEDAKDMDEILLLVEASLVDLRKAGKWGASGGIDATAREARKGVAPLERFRDALQRANNGLTPAGRIAE